MAKITIDKEEGIAEVIERMIASEDEEVTLVIPKGSPLARSAASFSLLKREADAAQKAVIVESVDDDVLALAKKNDLEASHPLWRGVRGSPGVSDIIPVGEEVMPDAPVEKEKNGRKRKKSKAEPTKLVVPRDSGVSDDDEEGENESAREKEKEKLDDETSEADKDGFEEGGIKEFEERESHFFSRRSGAGRGAANDKTDEDEDADEESGDGRKKSHKLVWGIVIALVVIVGALWIVTSVFGHAAIAIDFQKTPWSYGGSFAADKSVSTPNAQTNVIPAQVFTADKNATQLFPASGNANVSLKAQGTLTIYNAYSSAAQDLVATTRFVTPDGKLFRLVAGVTVPGAQVTNGQIIPSSVTATVAADQPGPAYNVSAVPKLTIPGFQGTAKYDGFYGALLGGATGGFTGARAVPTTADITSAKTKMTSILQDQLASNLTTSYPNNFKILDGATNVSVTKLTVNTTTDSTGNFSIFGEATLSAIGFDEGAFKNFLLSVAEAQAPTGMNGTFAWNALNLSYSNVHADFTKGRVSFTLTASGTLEQAFSPDDFKATIEGKSVDAARGMVAQIPGLENGKISVWPIWLWSIPSNPAKIQITTD